MSKKPSLAISKKERLNEAKKELEREGIDSISSVKTKQTTIILDEELLYSAKEVALQRKRDNIKPNTVTGMIRAALKEIVKREL